MSALQAIMSPICDIKNPLVLKLITMYSSLSQNYFNITLVWIPSHIGLPGNDMADEAAKEGLVSLNNILTVSLNFLEIKHMLNYKLIDEWQKYYTEK